MTSMAVIVLMLSSSVVMALFWYKDMVYNLPTPVPADHRSVEVGSVITLHGHMAQTAGMPVFVHFFNPRCPCSRFNLPQVQALARKYQDRIAFRVVVMPPEGKTYEKDDAYEAIGLDIPISFDRSIALACGVYSTPQAVLIDAQGKLYYRGNYNKNRYCTAPSTDYARMAINSLLEGTERFLPEEAALISYGCSLPVCNKE